jgi:hypothetical protein
MNFDSETFKDGRIATNTSQVNIIGCFFFLPYLLSYPINQVPLQPNSKDCACFVIYFAQKFFNNPKATLLIINVCMPEFPLLSQLIFISRQSFLPQQMDWLHGA